MSAQFDDSFFTPLWNKILDDMRERMAGPSFDTWFGGTKIVDFNLAKSTITVFVPTQFARDWLDGHYTSFIETSFATLTGEDYKVRFVSHAGLDTSSNPNEENTKTQDNAGNAAPVLPMSGQLNPLYTFEMFVIGASNRFAHAASLAVAEKPAQNYNPLFIYGGVGLGKTHLMHAIAHYVRKNNPQSNVLYLSSERFTNEFITSIRENSTEEFRNRYRTIDILLIDDIQFLANKEGTQEEFFHTFNALHEHGKQIVISSDRTPKAIHTLEDRLRSRFEWGLITDIQAPDVETRIAILQRKAKAEGIVISEDVLQYIADQVDSNIRELEGALTRVNAFSSVVNEDISVHLAQHALKDLISPNKPKTITVSQIQKVIGDHFGLKVEDLKARRRTRDIAFPRQIAMYLTRELTDMSLPRIGDAFGGRDHTTVLHACERITQELKLQQELKSTVDRLSEAIRSFF